MGETTEAIYLRLPSELLAKLDAWADEMNKRMRAVGAGAFRETNRTAAVRFLLQRGLEAIQADESLAIEQAEADDTDSDGNRGTAARKLASKLARPRKGGRRG